MTLKIKMILSTMVANANASSDRNPVTAQEKGHLSSHQAQLTTAEDGPVKRAQVLALKVGLNSELAVLLPS